MILNTYISIRVINAIDDLRMKNIQDLNFAFVRNCERFEDIPGWVR